MRLGLRPTIFERNTESSKLRRLYGSKDIAWERHRHRYEVEPKFVDQLEKKGGMRFVGKDERGERMQMLELESELFHFTPGLIVLNLVKTTLISSPFKPTLNSVRAR